MQIQRLLIIVLLLMTLDLTACERVAPQAEPVKAEQNFVQLNLLNNTDNVSLVSALMRNNQRHLLKLITIANETTEGVSAPVPSAITIRCRIPARTNLHFSHALQRYNPNISNVKIAFVVYAATTDENVRTIYRRTLESQADDGNQWTHARVPLDAFAGQVVDLIFQVLPEPESFGARPAPFEGLPVWGGIRLLAQPDAEAAAKPNFLWIVIDALRADHVGAYGYARPTTPNIDALAAQGTVYEKAFSHSPWTRASVASMLLSNYPHEICPTDCEGADFRIPVQLPTLPGVMHEAGYRTLALINNPNLNPSFSFGRGFDQLHEILDPDFPDALGRWLDVKTKGGPFFAYLHLFGVHMPYVYQEQYFAPFVDAAAAKTVIDLYDRNYMEQHPPQGQDLLNLIGSYDGQLASIDALVGRVWEELRARNLDKNTYLIITSDHGEEFGDHGGFEHGHTLYDELLHVPLILVSPNEKQARRDQRLVSLMDVAPTVLELAGIAAPPPFLGRSLLAADDGAERIVLSENLLYGSPATSLRSQSLKYVFAHLNKEEKVYDLLTDPGETKNLVADPKILEAGRDLYAAFDAQMNKMQNRRFINLICLSKTPRNWEIAYRAAPEFAPVVSSAARSFQWRRPKAMQPGRLSFTTEEKTPFHLAFPLQGLMNLRGLDIRIDGQRLTAQQLVVPPEAAGFTPTDLFNELLAPDTLRLLQATRTPALPKPLPEAALVLWVESAITSRGAKQVEELRERLRSIGYLQ